jgi:hypothetical protein
MLMQGLPVGKGDMAPACILGHPGETCVRATQLRLLSCDERTRDSIETFIAEELITRPLGMSNWTGSRKDVSKPTDDVAAYAANASLASPTTAATTDAPHPSAVKADQP